MDDFSSLWYDCDGIESTTSREQCDCERECSNFLNDVSSKD